MRDRLEVQRRLELRQLTRSLLYSPSSLTTTTRPISGCTRSGGTGDFPGTPAGPGSSLVDSLLAVPQAVVGCERWRWDGIAGVRTSLWKISPKPRSLLSGHVVLLTPRGAGNKGD
jgi:hypothetical protein